MQRLHVSLIALAACALFGAHASAANIAWVTPHATGPSGPAMTAGFTEAPDIGYTNMLAAAGHSITRVQVPATGANAAIPAELLATLNASDLIIISRSCNSGSFQEAAETLSWNADVTKPMIISSGYLVRPNRLAYYTADTPIPDITGPTSFVAPNPSHPIFAGISLNGSNETGEILNVVNAPITGNPLQRGTSILNPPAPPIVAGGTIVAQIVSSASVAANAAVISEFPAGTPSGNAGETFNSKRLIFFTGSREVDGGNSDTAGILDLSSVGQQLYMNAVCYMVPGGCDPIIPGDTDGDGIGGEFPQDFDPIRNNFRKSVSSRALGDLVPDGVVDFKDFRQWKTAHLGGGGSVAGLDLSFMNVPEPTTLVVAWIGIGMVCSASRRTRRKGAAQFRSERVDKSAR